MTGRAICIHNSHGMSDGIVYTHRVLRQQFNCRRTRNGESSSVNVCVDWDAMNIHIFLVLRFMKYVMRPHTTFSLNFPLWMQFRKRMDESTTARCFLFCSHFFRRFCFHMCDWNKKTRVWNSLQEKIYDIVNRFVCS